MNQLNGRWTEAEITTLIMLFSESDRTIVQISKELNRSYGSVRSKLYRLNKVGTVSSRYENWSEDDDIYLELANNDKESTLQEVADFLGRSRNAIDARLNHLRKNYNLKNMKHIWTDEEVEELKALYPQKSSYYLANYFRTSRFSILKKAERLGLTGNGKRVSIKHLDNEVRRLCNEGRTRKEIASKLNIPYETVKKYIWKNNIPCKNSETSEGWLKYHRQQNQIHYAERGNR
ncbi:hypothetical protein ACTGXS_06810 [Streptococcus suis]